MITITFDFQWASLTAFIIILSILAVYNRKKSELQKILFPAIYSVIYRTNFGLKFIKKISAKHRELVKLLGYCGVGFGFAGMLAMVAGIIFSLATAFTTPSPPSSVALLLPQTTIPGLGFLPFWYWIIALFVIVLVHEFAHGIVASAHGLKIKSSGLGVFSIFIPIIPIAFVEPDDKNIEKKQDIVQYSIFAAGPFSNILTALIALLAFTLILNPAESIISEPAGISFSKINESYPAHLLPDGLIISNLNGRQINNANEFALGLHCTQPGEKISIGNKTHSFEITTTELQNRAFIGITNIKDARTAKKEFAPIYPAYLWLRGLIKWIGWLSFFVGTANLLPIGPIDGGRMIKTLTARTAKNRKDANKKWVAVSIIVTAVILLLIIYPLIKKIF